MNPGRYRKPKVTDEMGGVLVRLLLVWLIICLPLFDAAAETPIAPDKPSRAWPAIQGLVTDAATGRPLVGVTVRLDQGTTVRITDSIGAFTLPHPPTGSISVTVSHVGYEARQILLPPGRQPAPLRIELYPRVVSLAGMTVTPGRFLIDDNLTASARSVRKEVLRATPQFGEDLHRAVGRLPGLTSNDFSARFVVRGGEYDQMLVLLDGMEIEEPFHLRDIDGGVISIVDIASISRVDLATGGFGARYGDRLSGVFDLASRPAAPTGHRFETSVSLTNLRASGEGRFAEKRGAWLVSARRGYAEWALQLSDRDENIRPVYYDVFARTAFSLSAVADLAVNFLHGHDNLYFEDTGNDQATMIHDNSYVWLTLSAHPHTRLKSTSVVSIAAMAHDRAGSNVGSSVVRSDFEVDDQRTYRAVGVKQEYAVELSPRLVTFVGLQYRHLTADYAYHMRTLARSYTENTMYTYVDSVDRGLVRAADQWGVYLSPRVRVFAPLTVELGLRFDSYSASRDHLLSPRANVHLQVRTHTAIRAGWGRYTQFQRLYSLAIPDHDLTYYPATHAEHRVLGLEHEFPNGIQLRIEGYRKLLTELPPVYRNWLDQVTLFPEVGYDRVRVHRSRAEARGLEMFLGRQSHARFTWRVSYALAKVTETVSGLEVDGESVPYHKTIPGPYDQRHALKLDLSYSPHARWQGTVAWEYRSGWPYTAAAVVGNSYASYLVPDEPMAARNPAVHRLDVRLTRTFETGNGHISVFVEVMNVYNRHNVRTNEYGVAFDQHDNLVVTEDPIHYLGITPSVGFTWRFGG